MPWIDYKTHDRELQKKEIGRFCNVLTHYGGEGDMSSEIITGDETWVLYITGIATHSISCQGKRQSRPRLVCLRTGMEFY